MSDNLLPGFATARASDVGMVRNRNEDACFTLEITMPYDGRMIPVGLFIVADGMGGHRGGDIASSVATRVTAKCIIRDFISPILEGATNSWETDIIYETLLDAVSEANNAVHEASPKSRTTLTAALVARNRAYIAHVGDSRAYMYRKGRAGSGEVGSLQQISHDHSLVAQLVEWGQATPEEAMRHPQRNILYKAIGQGEDVEVDTYSQIIPPDGCLLLCSDGLWGMLGDEQIAGILQDAGSLQGACRDMVNAANEKGGEDNITVILVAVND